MKPRLQQRYLGNVLPELRTAHSIKNTMQLPRVTKVCLNMGVGKHHGDTKALGQLVDDLTAITGQKAVKALSRSSEASFKIREGMPVGIRVTLRRQRMWEFLDRFINVAAPRIRDFRGFSRQGFDARGNYSFGVGEQSIFPEVNLDKMEASQGMNITVVFENSRPEISERALEMMGFPFERRKK